MPLKRRTRSRRAGADPPGRRAGPRVLYWSCARRNEFHPRWEGPAGGPREHLAQTGWVEADPAEVPEPIGADRDTWQSGCKFTPDAAPAVARRGVAADAARPGVLRPGLFRMRRARPGAVAAVRAVRHVLAAERCLSGRA